MSDYSALAQRVSLSIAGIRGCLMLSRDGSILGAHPEGEPEADLRTAWVRFAGVGDPDRSYVEFPDQIWAFVRRGSYAAFAVAQVGVRPGVLVDTLEQALLSAEQERVVDREAMRLPEALSAPSGKPRTSLHMADRQPTAEPEPAIGRAEAADGASAAESPRADEVASTPPPDVADPPAAEPDPPAAEPDPPADDVPEAQEGKEEETEVDRILLAKEFAGLLQVPREDDEASR
ncbi:MAG TPA: hypothetical protein VF195_09000 [Actinomycetota bacterium]